MKKSGYISPQCVAILLRKASDRINDITSIMMNPKLIVLHHLVSEGFLLVSRIEVLVVCNGSMIVQCIQKHVIGHFIAL